MIDHNRRLNLNPIFLVLEDDGRELQCHSLLGKRWFECGVEATRAVLLNFESPWLLIREMK
jgi:hypothetical protein